MYFLKIYLLLTIFLWERDISNVTETDHLIDITRNIITFIHNTIISYPRPIYQIYHLLAG